MAVQVAVTMARAAAKRDGEAGQWRHRAGEAFVRLQMSEDEALGRGEVVEQPPRRAHQVRHALAQLLRLGAPVGAADDETVSLPLVGAQLSQHAWRCTETVGSASGALPGFRAARHRT